MQVLADLCRTERERDELAGKWLAHEIHETFWENKMTKAGARIMEAVKEATEIAKGAIPAARIWHNGWAYVPQPRSIDEAIVAAAVIFDEEVWMLPAPARHHHILWAIDQVHPGRAIEAHVQGFMTNTGRFVEREVAAHIAKMAGQIDKLTAPPQLFSEDLW